MKTVGRGYVPSRERNPCWRQQAGESGVFEFVVGIVGVLVGFGARLHDVFEGTANARPQIVPVDGVFELPCGERRPRFVVTGGVCELDG